MKKHYEKANAKHGLDMSIQFTSTEITLVIPENGITVKEEWIIKPLFSPKVNNYDNYSLTVL